MPHIRERVSHVRHLLSYLQQFKASGKVTQRYDRTFIYQLHAAIGIPFFVDAAQRIGDDPEMVTGIYTAIYANAHGFQGGEDIFSRHRIFGTERTGAAL